MWENEDLDCARGILCAVAITVLLLILGASLYGIWKVMT